MKDSTNIKFLEEFFLECPDTSKELRIVEMYNSEEGFVIVVESEDGNLKYKHIINTEEV